MVYQGVRRCDMCSSEMLGRGGCDICYLCKLLIEEDADVAADEKPTSATNVLMFPQRGAKSSIAARRR
jgi:hypothetical protein